jgi:SAM-dependent methyltransferase
MPDKNYATDAEKLREHYRDSGNLSARQRIYRFAAPGGTPWFAFVFDQILGRVPPTARVLELGCGNAALWRDNLGRVPPGWRVTLTDLSSGMVDEARRSIAGATDPSRFTFGRVDAQHLPFPDASFDAVVANHMLYHVPDRRRALSEIRRVLVHGGHLFAATNDVRHLGELMQLLDRHAPPPRPLHLFSLDDGAELGEFFTSVDVLRSGGELRVTDAQAIVDYALSIEWVKPVLVGPMLDAMRREVEQQIATHGAFVIRSATGLFVARA